MKSPNSRVCIISSEIVGPHKNGGIGTHCFYLAQFLAQELKQQVTFLYTSKIEIRDEAYWQTWFRRELNLEFVSIFSQPQAQLPPASGDFHYGSIAAQVYQYLRTRSFDVCYFQEMLGNGFDCFRAKNTGVAFANTLLTCTLHSSWEWICQAMLTFPQGALEELRTKCLERYCVEHADIAISPSQYMFDWAAANGFRLPQNRHVLPYLFDSRLQPVGYRAPQNHLIFFGRLEVRKGLLVFLDALVKLSQMDNYAAQGMKVTFLGKPHYTPDGGGLQSIKKYSQYLPASFVLEAKTDLNHHEAMDFLSAHNDALVVCPSLVDNSPYAVIESLQLGLNIIASNTGGIPEFFTENHRLFEPQPEPLALKIRAGLRQELPRLERRYDVAKSRQLWRDFCETTLPAADPKPHRVKGKAMPSVQVLIPVSPANVAMLPETLRRLDRQAHADLSIALLSKAPISIPVSEHTRHPVKVIDLAHTPVDEIVSSINRVAFDFAVVLAPQLCPEPEMISVLVEGMLVGDCDLLTSWAGIIDSTAPGNAGATHLYEPLGGFLEVGLLGNIFSAGGLMVKRARVPQLLQLGHDLGSPDGLWTCLSTMVQAGCQFDVVPQMLFTLRADRSLLAVPRFHYEQQQRVIQGISRGLPEWLGRFIVYGLAADKRVVDLYAQMNQKNHGSSRGGKIPGGVIVFKIKRETRRFAEQIRGLFQRQIRGTKS
jgi:O-antigen biosynthesis protein